MENVLFPQKNKKKIGTYEIRALGIDWNIRHRRRTNFNFMSSADIVKHIYSQAELKNMYPPPSPRISNAPI